MRRNVKAMVISMLAARIGRLLRRRGYHSAASMLEHELHRRSGHGHYSHHGRHPGHYGRRPRRRRFHW